VGSLSKRRTRLLDGLREAGLILSPYEGDDIENIALQSKCLLNVHKNLSNHLEIPRIVAGLSTATPIVTEACHGLGDVFDADRLVIGKYRDLISLVQDLLGDQPRLEAMASATQAEFARYSAMARAVTIASVKAVEALPKLAEA
jgi:hypothetical protein